MFLLFELIMRYVNYKTFINSSKCNKECRKICRKLIPELKKIKIFDNYHETYWKQEKQGLCYYFDDSYFKVLDFDEGVIIAKYHSSYFSEYLEIDEKRYFANIDCEKLIINIPNILNYNRKHFSLKPVSFLFL